MRDNPIQLAFAAIVLVLGAGVEELLPRIFGLGFPVILAVVLVFAPRGTALSTALVALCAGALEESLSSLPPLTAVSYFLIVGAAARRTDGAWPVIVLAYPIYQVWLTLWVGGLGGRIFGRMLVSIPVGVLTVCAVGLTWAWLGRKAAIDECG